MTEAVALAERLAGTSSSSSGTARRPATSAARRPTGRRRERELGWRAGRRSRTGSRRSGNGSLVGSRLDERARARDRRPRRRARGRPRLGLAADRRALVAAGRRARRRCRARPARLARRRRRLPGEDAAVPGPAVHAGRRRPDPEPADEPEDRERDHPLRGAIQEAAEASGLRPGAAARQRHARRRSCRRSDPERRCRRSWRSSCEAPTRPKAERASVSFAKSVTDGIATYVDNKMVLARGGHRATKGPRSRRPTSASPRRSSSRRHLATNTNLSLAERLLIQANINTTLQFYEQRSQVLRAEQTESEQLLSLAQQVEQTRVLEEGVGVRTDATSRRNAMAVGGLLGLLAGAARRVPLGAVRGAPEAPRPADPSDGRGQARRRRRPRVRRGAPRRGDAPRHPGVRRPDRGRRRRARPTRRRSARARSATRASRWSCTRSTAGSALRS